MFKSPDLAMGICDAGSSLICFPFAEDFKEGTLAPTTVKRSINGIAGGLAITHTGITNFKTEDTEGRIVSIQ